jgi:E2/UBC family protein E
MLERRERELELVEAQFGELERAPDLSWFVIKRLPLPPGWSKSETAILIVLAPGYPETPPDNFHTDADLTLDSGGEPGNASGMVDHAGRRWRQFSWHFEDTNEWRPDAEIERGHNLLTFLLGMQQRLADAN